MIGGNTMPVYPDNSHSAREKRCDSAAQEKKVDKVVTGAVKLRKKSEARKLASIFTPDDMENIKSYIVTDVIIPGVKNAVADAVSILLFGDSGRLGTRKSSGSKLMYQRCYDGRQDCRRDNDHRRNVPGYEHDDIIFDTRGEAELVLDRLDEIIATYGMASVADLYDLAGITNRRYTDNKYGWTDIRGAKPRRVSDGYILLLPRALPIN